MARTRSTLTGRTLSALYASENGALTEYAIRELAGSMRAVPSLERKGLVSVEVSDCWIERDDDPRVSDRIPDVISVRLTEAGWNAEGLDPADYHRN